MNDTERFWLKVRKTDRCWLWLAATTEGGYGMTRWKGRQRLAHRLSWYLHTGTWPTAHVCHTCDEPACVRPSHLKLGTQAENIADCVARGRRRNAPTRQRYHVRDWRAGACNGRAKLTPAQVADLRRRYRTGRFTQAALAADFGLSQTGVSAIVRKQNWSK